MAACLTVNKQNQLIVVVQGLRGYFVAQKGRNVAVIALSKSIACTFFFDETLKVGRESATGRSFRQEMAVRALTAQAIAENAIEII